MRYKPSSYDNEIVILGLIGIVILLVGAGLWYFGVIPERSEKKEIQSFAECAEAGNPVAESYPRQCRTPGGAMFVEDIGNELEKTDFIRMESPRPNAIVASPLEIRGVARGFWFFEASFPAELYDGFGKKIGIAIVTAQSEWMTENFVPFLGTLEFPTPATATGFLILHKDNPSGLPEHDDSLRIPVRFR